MTTELPDNHSTPPATGAVGSQFERRVRPGAVWDSMRCTELERLQELLHEVTAINKGSDCLGRIARCIEIAELLNRPKLGDRTSFKQFLRGLAIEDRFGPQA
jgi:hypothetical protein